MVEASNADEEAVVNNAAAYVAVVSDRTEVVVVVESIVDVAVAVEMVHTPREVMALAYFLQLRFPRHQIPT